MKLVKGIVATTHVDLHGDRMALQALQGLARQVGEHYLPVDVNHDPRYPPVGRVDSAEIIELPDGEYAIQCTQEMFEEADSLESLNGDGRKIRIKDQNIQTIAVEYDRTFRDEKGEELLRELSQISGEDEKPTQTLKKAVEPISTLLIAAGICALGSIAVGFFTKLGSDFYDKLKNALISYYRDNNSSERLLDFCFVTQQNNSTFEIHVLVVNPTEQKLNELFNSRFNEIDTRLSSLPLIDSDVAKIVFEYNNQKLLMLYAVRSDSVPVLWGSEVHFIE